MMQNPRQPSGVHKRGLRKHRMQRHFPRLSPMENQAETFCVRWLSL